MRSLLCLALGVALLTGWGEANVSDVIVSQRWPWSEKVDVDFTISAASEVEVSAVWDGQSTPVLLGTVSDAKPGRNRFSWDPSISPFADKTLPNFSVTLTPVQPSTNRYLVIDLADGGVSYRAQPDGADGKWSDDYKTSKMVFRRIPAGTYRLGAESNVIARAYGKPIDAVYATAWKRHDITFTSDFYVGVFKLTNAQYDQLTGTSSANPKRAKKLSYDDLRGSVTNSVNWPVTGYKVASGSLVAKLREKTGPTDFYVDLCTETQWEAAMRAGKDTVWPNGGTMDDSLPVWTNIVNEIAWWGDSGHDVGLKAENGWGIYDALGLVGDWTLNAANYKNTLPTKGLSDGTDPVGSSLTEPKKRVIRGSGDRNMYNQLPCVRQVVEHQEDRYYTTRFCIHLQPLVADDAK